MNFSDRAWLLLVLIWSLSSSSANVVGAQDEPAYLRMSISDLVVSQTGSGEKSNRQNLCDGDRLIKWNNVELKDNDHLVELWLASGHLKTVPMLVERDFGSGDVQTLTIEYPIQLASNLFADCMTGGRSDYRKPIEIFPEWERAEELPLKETAEELLDETAPQAVDRLATVFQRLTDFVKGHYRSDHIVYLLNRPFHSEVWSRKFCDSIATAESIEETISRCWSLASPRCRPLQFVTHPDETISSLDGCCKVISRRVDSINRHYQAALSNLSSEERKLWNAWCRDLQPKWRGEDGWDELSAGFQLTKKIDVSLLEQAIAESAQLTAALSPGGIIYQALATLENKPTASSTIGIVRIGSTSTDRHDVSQNAIIDFGGDDHYVYPESGLDEDRPIRFIVDLSGSDHYTGTKNAIAAGVAGISVLIDGGGDDVYEVNRNGVGFAVCGLGVLYDHEGNDHYRGRVFSQGAGCIGLGLIFDRDGNDRYDAGHYSQGIGMPGGCGAIIDGQGDDNYTCTGKFGSPYGDQGEYDGMGQGCGFGFRYLGCGGVGLLMDKAGRDFYRAGQFGLGCGYFFGIGLVNDRGGDDVFECSRYGLGSAAHYAVGIVLDDGGNDFYTATRRSSVAVMGSSWDLSLGALIDASGDDIYRAQSYALGGAAQNAYGFLWDKAGNDTYIADRHAGAALGYTGGATYGAGRGARNLAIFLDESGDDHYQTSGHKNGSSGLVGEFGIRVDR